MFDRVFGDLKTNRVLNDNFHASRQLTEHLIGQGYRSIIHFGGPPNINIYDDRLAGFHAAVEAHAREGIRGQAVENVITKDRGREETDRLIENNIPFDAIFAASDYSALGALLSLRDHKIEVPGTVGVAGFANEPFTELLELTTVDQQSSEVGMSAARLLFEGIDSGNSWTGKEIMIRPEIIVRNSTLKQ
jgi:LacI family transcriptional regulator